MIEQPIVVFTDGGAKVNPGPGGWGVIIVTPDARVTELGGGAPHTTNNRMELSAVIAALARLERSSGSLRIYTDSTYVIQGITKWVWGWRKRSWKTAQGTDVLNRELWEQLAELVGSRGSSTIDWRWVKGHAGTPGNERVDEIAVAFSSQQDVVLYDGPIAGYPLAILDVPESAALVTSSPRKARPAAADAAAKSYLSLVDGILMKHATWIECERRVKGRAGARFKKATTAADEVAILRAWGLTATRQDRPPDEL